MPLAYGQVAAGASNTGTSPNTQLPMRLGNLGDQIISELHGRYYEQTYRRNVFSAAVQAVGTTTVGLATTYTGLCVSNPLTSTVNLVILKASLMQSVIQSAQPEAFALAVGISTTAVTHTTPVVAGTGLRNNFISSSYTGQALADTAATLPAAPTYHTFLQNTASATVNGNGGVFDLEGSIILPPGAYICFVTPAQASVAGMWFSLTWEEVPAT